MNPILFTLLLTCACTRQPANPEQGPLREVAAEQPAAGFGSPEGGPPPPECEGQPVDRAWAFERVIDGQAGACERASFLRTLEARGSGAGPWLEDLFVAVSPDGLEIDPSTSRLIRKSAAVAEAVRGDDGKVYLLFGEGDIDRGRQIVRGGDEWFRRHGLIGYGALALLVSEDGLHFEEATDFGVDGLVRGMVVDPEILRLPDGGWRLYYIGVPIPELLGPEAWKDGTPHSLFFAESADLVHWRQIGEAVRGPFADPTVWCRTDGACDLFSTGLDRGRSTDGGRSFTFDGPHGVPGFAPELLPLGPDAARLYYNSKERGGPLRSLITRDAGQSWHFERNLVEPYRVEAVSMLPRPEGGFLVYYHYWKEGYSGDSWDEGSRPK